MIPGKLYKIIWWDDLTAYNSNNGQIRLPQDTILLFVKKNNNYVFDECFFINNEKLVSIWFNPREISKKIKEL